VNLRVRVTVTLSATVALAFSMTARAQDDGARVYQLAPVGFQTFTAFVVNKRGNEGPDPGETTPGSETRSDVLVLRYARTFSLVGHQLTPFAILPMGRIKVAQGTGKATESSGFGDAQIGATVGLLGAPALSGEEYASYRPDVSMSLLGRIYFPSGAYSHEQPVNLGANRISYQLGLPTTFMFGQSFRDERLTTLEVLPTVTFYEANHEPFGANKRTQQPLFSVEAHLTHNITSRIWVSADLLYRNGGESRTDGIDNNDPLHGYSAGGTFVFPLGGTSLALTYEHVVKRWDGGPIGWFARTAWIAPF
jgi:hypothetical protein